jgi:acetolactate synthase-1/2/3 large subunit
MKVSDYILNFLVAHNVTHIFGVTGGFITPLFDAFSERTDINYICCQTEQAAAMAADGYARFKGLGCAIATSGPGATNLITGIGCSWFDSIPVLFITGQVPTSEARQGSRVRQRGFQETDIVSIVDPITKYAIQIEDVSHVAAALDCALYRATHGRPGPVLLDIPMDIQQAEMPDEPRRYIPVEASPSISSTDIERVVKMIVEASRPVVIYGQGARHARFELIEFIEETGIPCLPSWAALDLIPHDHPLYVEQFGVYGNRAGNFAVQNADLIIAIGTRLDGRMTGKQFAPKARKVVVDIDIAEAQKNKPDVMIVGDALDFLGAMSGGVRKGLKMILPFYRVDWNNRIKAWKEKYSIKDDTTDPIQPRAFIRQLNDLVTDDAIIVADAGANLSWTVQAWHVYKTQRLFSDYGFSCMGYALPAAIGASIATGKPVVCIIGDGGMQMNIQELQTLRYYNIPVKVFILNNHSYGIIKQFQEELYHKRYNATDEAGGYSVPDFPRVANGYGIKAWTIPVFSTIGWMVAQALLDPGPFVCNVEIDTAARIFPKVCFGNSLENQSPLLPADEVAENMKD